MTTPANRSNQIGVYGALCTLVGIVVSGPLAMLLVNGTHPQPPWAGPELFARNYHPIQISAYLAGLFLVSGLVVLIAAAHAVAGEEHRAQASVGVVFVSVYAALVSFNYVVQTSFVPVLAGEYAPENGPLLTALSMSNPRSLAWAIEMWGYGFAGVATWLVAPVFRGSRLERATRWLFVANGVLSVAGAAWTALRPGWVMTESGLVSFALWNALALVMAVFAFAAFRVRANELSRPRR